VVLYSHYSTLSSPLPFCLNKISWKEQVCVDWVYKKALWSVVKYWEFERNLMCSKILKIWRKNPIKLSDENSEESRLFTGANLVLRPALVRRKSYDQVVMAAPKYGEIALWPNTRVVKCKYCVSQKQNKIQWYSILLTLICKFNSRALNECSIWTQ